MSGHFTFDLQSRGAGSIRARVGSRVRAYRLSRCPACFVGREASSAASTLPSSPDSGGRPCRSDWFLRERARVSRLFLGLADDF